VTLHERLFSSGLDHDAERGRHNSDSIVAVILDALEHRISAPALIDAWSQAFEPNQELLDNITAFPMRRALFTNNGPMLDLCLEGPLWNLDSTFDTTVCSWHLQATKPSPEAFTLAAARLGTSPPYATLGATAYYWPIDELSAQLLRAGFVEIEHHQRPGDAATHRRAHAAIVAVAR
jgi:hypothetical protein